MPGYLEGGLPKLCASGSDLAVVFVARGRVHDMSVGFEQGLGGAKQPRAAFELPLRHRHSTQPAQTVGDQSSFVDLAAQRQTLRQQRSRPRVVALVVRQVALIAERTRDARSVANFAE